MSAAASWSAQDGVAVRARARPNSACSPPSSSMPGIVLSRDQLLDLTVGRYGRRLRPHHRQPGQPAAQEDRGRPEESDADQDALGRRLLLHRRGGPGMMLLWRRSLAARFLLLVLLALALSQAITFLISWDERGQALQAAAKGEFVSRTSSLAILLETTPPSLRPRHPRRQRHGLHALLDLARRAEQSARLAAGGAHAARQAAARASPPNMPPHERAGFERGRCRRSLGAAAHAGPVRQWRPVHAAGQIPLSWTPPRTAWAFPSASTTAPG